MPRDLERAGLARPRRTLSSRGALRGSPGAIRGSGRSVGPCHAWLGQATASPVPPITASPGFPVAAARPKQATSPCGGCPLPRGGSAEGLHGGWMARGRHRPASRRSHKPPAAVGRGGKTGRRGVLCRQGAPLPLGGRRWLRIPENVSTGRPHGCPAPGVRRGQETVQTAAHRLSLPCSGRGKNDFPGESCCPAPRQTVPLWMAEGTPPGRDQHPRRRQPLHGRGRGELSRVAEERSSQGRDGAGGDSHCGSRRGSDMPAGVWPPPVASARRSFGKRGKHRALGTCQHRAHTPAGRAAAVASRRRGWRGRECGEPCGTPQRSAACDIDLPAGGTGTRLSRN